MQHVGQRFDMHQPMLNRYIQQSAQRKTVARLRVGIETYLCEILVESAADTAYVIADGVQGGPVGGQIGGKSAADWIDAEGKEPIKFGMSALQPEDGIRSADSNRMPRGVQHKR